MMRLVQVQPAIKVTMLGPSSAWGTYQDKHGRTCDVAPAQTTGGSLGLKAASPRSFCSRSSLVQGWTRAPKGSVEPKEPDCWRG